MIVIIAEINNREDMPVSEASKLNQVCTAIGVKLLINIHSVEKLTEVLEKNKKNTCLLFSNFPPNSSYPESGKSINMVDKGDYYLLSWDADSYSKSLPFFKGLCTKYKLKAIHFITGAPEKRIGDDLLKALSPHTPMTITRKDVLITPAHNYALLYRLLIVQKIKEAIRKNPIG